MAIKQNAEFVGKRVRIKPLKKILKLEGYTLKCNDDKEWVEDSHGYTRLIQQEFNMSEIGVITAYKTYNIDGRIIYNIEAQFNNFPHGWLAPEMLEFLD